MERGNGIGVMEIGKGMNGVFDEIGLYGRERYWKLTKAESIARQGDCGRGVEGDQGVFV